MKKTKGKQNYLIHKIKELGITHGIILGVKTLADEGVLYIESGHLSYDWVIESLEAYLDNIREVKRVYDARNEREPRRNTTVALPFAITREALEDNLFGQADTPIGTIDFARNLVYAGHGQWIDRHTGEVAGDTGNVDVEWRT